MFDGLRRRWQIFKWGFKQGTDRVRTARESGKGVIESQRYAARSTVQAAEALLHTDEKEASQRGNGGNRETDL